jgi:hypothetical protein
MPAIATLTDIGRTSIIAFNNRKQAISPEKMERLIGVVCWLKRQPAKLSKHQRDTQLFTWKTTGWPSAGTAPASPMSPRSPLKKRMRPSVRQSVSPPEKQLASAGLHLLVDAADSTKRVVDFSCAQSRFFRSPSVKKKTPDPQGRRKSFFNLITFFLIFIDSS